MCASVCAKFRVYGIHGLTKHRLWRSHPYLAKRLIVEGLEFACSVEVLLFGWHGLFLVERYCRRLVPIIAVPIEDVLTSLQILTLQELHRTIYRCLRVVQGFLDGLSVRVEVTELLVLGWR